MMGGGTASSAVVAAGCRRRLLQQPFNRRCVSSSSLLAASVRGRLDTNSIFLSPLKKTRGFGGSRPLHTTPVAWMSGEIADRCNINLVHSPYPPIPSGPHPPLYEVVSQNWKKPHPPIAGFAGTTGTAHVGGGGTGEYLDQQVAIVDYSKGLQRTFRNYATTTTALGTALHELLEHDHKDETNTAVAFYAPNHVDYLPTVLAVSLMGAKVTPINPVYTPQELEPVLQCCRASVLIVHQSVIETALKAVKHCPLIKEVIVLTDDDTGRSPVPEGTINYHQLVREYEHKLHHFSHHASASSSTIIDDHPPKFLYETHPIVKANGTNMYPVCLPYSSGTTGLPKGVCLTHSNLISNLYQLENVEGLGFAPDHKCVSPLPFFHIYAFTVSLMYCAWKGHTLITMSERFDLEEFCKLVEQHKPQRAHLVPPILVGLAKHPCVDKYDLTSLQTIVSAAAPLGENTEEAVSKRIRVRIKQAWGMSELSPVGTVNSDFNAISGSIGPLVASTTAKVVDENGKSLPSGKTGELVIRGPQVMLGYLDEPEKTSECLSPNGWLRTGDMAYYDENGFFYITDRIKELIKVRGFPVAPAELEELLLTHPAIADVAVIGKPDAESGELPRAYVVLKSPGEEDTIPPESIVEWVSERVAHYKRLKGGVVYVDSIPKSASGKILRRILKEGLPHESIDESMMMDSSHLETKQKQ